MKALALFHEENELRVIEKDTPDPADGEALVRTLSVGVDGSDRRIAAGEIGGTPPDGDDHLVLGHEAVGIVEDANGTDFEEGDVVVPMVRRPAETSRFGQTVQLDMAPPGTFHERGIIGAHGYAAEFFTSEPEYLVSIPETIREYGFFIEPASIVEKSLDQAFAARSAFDWQPSAALVLGNGNLGLLALSGLAVGEEFDRLYCLARRSRPDPTIDVVESVGGMYVDSRKTPLKTVADAYRPVDYIFEATGYPRHATEGVNALAPNGVLTLQGIPASSTFEFDGGDYHADLVVNNKAILGVVNARRKHFEAAVERINSIPNAVLNNMVTGIYEIDAFEQAFADPRESIKSVIYFDNS